MIVIDLTEENENYVTTLILLIIYCRIYIVCRFGPDLSYGNQENWWRNLSKPTCVLGSIYLYYDKILSY